MKNLKMEETMLDLNTLVNHVPGGIAVYKMVEPLRIMYYNDGVCALSGHTREEYQAIVQEDAMAIVCAEDRLLLRKEIISATVEKRKIDFTYRIYHKTRNFVWIHLSAIHVGDNEAKEAIYYAIFMDISDERKVQSMLKKVADHDHMTGLLNRISFGQRIEEELLKNDASIAAFIMIDIDNFKQVNDFLGHVKGDEVLCKIADFLNKYFGRDGFVSRIGGDEFAVYLPEVTSMDRLHEQLEKFNKVTCLDYQYQDCSIHLSCSMGIAMIPKDGTGYPQLYENADKALLYAKNNGKNQFQFFDQIMAPPSPLLLKNMEWLLDEGTNAIYVCNSETYELLYMNKIARDKAGVAGNSFIGKPCYKEFMHNEEPCQYCKMKEMNTESFYDRDLTLPFFDKPIMLKGKLINWDGILAHVEFISFATDFDKAK